jgi:hypothetical protein
MMLSHALENKMFCFKKVMLHIGMEIFTNKAYDGESITDVMDSTSERVPLSCTKIWVINDKMRLGT